jgi:hypothetical protein
MDTTGLVLNDILNFRQEQCCSNAFDPYMNCFEIPPNIPQDANNHAFPT